MNQKESKALFEKWFEKRWGKWGKYMIGVSMFVRQLESWEAGRKLGESKPSIKQGGPLGDGDYYPSHEKIMRNNPAR